MSDSLTQIPELANLDSGRGLVRIPIEQDVPFTPRVRAIVDTPQFQRLQHITQLGLTSKVYPGAVHSRFEHALGVFHNALRYLGQLIRDERFCDMIDRHHAELLMVTALLHDLGHWPFCHPIEDLELPGIPSHEQFAATFLTDDSELTQVLRQEWGVEPAEVLQLLTGKADTPARQMLQSILSGPIDIDKMDYLERDSLHAGVPYGRNFDKKRLIHSLVVNESGNGLALSSKGKTAAELMVFARYVMFSEVYWHHAVRSATAMFSRAFFHLHSQIDPTKFFRKSEQEAIQELRWLASATSCERLVEGVFGPKRQLYKRVAEYNYSQRPEVYQKLARQPFGYLAKCAKNLTKRLEPALKEELLATDIVFDGPSRHREIEFKVQIYFPKEERYLPLSQVSPVVDTLARRQFDDYVKRVRVFAHPRIARRLARTQLFEDALNAAIADTQEETT